ncbi:MAG TPA: hypothetical protein VIY90_00015 [Steroidobacteraceae bacterium]
MMQVDQRGQRAAWDADLHAGAGDRIQHPRRHNRHYAGQCLNMNHISIGSSLAVVTAYATPMQRVPSIMNNHIPSDMGRMTPQCVYRERIVSLPAATLARHTAHLAMSL